MRDKLKIWDGNTLHEDEKANDILVSFDCEQLNSNNFQVLVNLSEIITYNGKIGHIQHEIFTFHIHSLKTYEKELITV